MQPARTQTSNFPHLVLRRSPGSEPSLLHLFHGLEINLYQSCMLRWQLLLKSPNIFCVLSCTVSLILSSDTHIQVLLLLNQNLSGMYLGLRRAPHTSLPSQYFHFSSLFCLNINSAGSSCFTVGSWMTPELRDIFTSRTATQLLLFKRESHTSVAVQALATCLTLSCRA